ncbi:MAG: hypothetical protein ACREM3_28560 [Candidatus Rokuibacteriota bacterium]
MLFELIYTDGKSTPIALDVEAPGAMEAVRLGRGELWSRLGGAAASGEYELIAVVRVRS